MALVIRAAGRLASARLTSIHPAGDMMMVMGTVMEPTQYGLPVEMARRAHGRLGPAAHLSPSSAESSTFWAAWLRSTELVRNRGRSAATPTWECTLAKAKSQKERKTACWRAAVASNHGRTKVIEEEGPRPRRRGGGVEVRNETRLNSADLGAGS